MKKTIQRAGILFFIFIAAVVVYFIGTRRDMEKETTVYSALEEPSLPVVYAVSEGREFNCLHGYVQDMGNRAARESITVLPENRALGLRIAEYGNTITGVNYEIRSLAMDRLVERTEISEWKSEGGNTNLTLPIQNLLTRDEPYLLTLTLGLGEREVNYYTRIMWAENSHAGQMLELAQEFTGKSLDYEQARDLAMYLETSPTEDNSSLGYVTLRSSFNHLTWDGQQVAMVGEPQVILKDYDGLMGQVQVRYSVKLTESSGREVLLRAEDNFTMKWGEQRIYMMAYERRAQELFEADAAAFSSKRILLGINDLANLSSLQSPKANSLAFVTNGALWVYQQKEKAAVCVFTFYSEADDGVRSDYDQHGIKILRVQEDGSSDFLVYGYMNRGSYEGQSGVVLYHYDGESRQVEERFFIPSSESYEQIHTDISRLSYLNGNDMVYLMLDGRVCGIDLKSNESLVVASGLEDGDYAVSLDGSRFAWQEEGENGKPQKIQVMDFAAAQKQEVTGEEGDLAYVLGFVGNDLIYGFAREGDAWIVNGRQREVPMYALYIADRAMEIASEYRKEGIYLSSVRAEEGRIHLRCLVKTGEHDYSYQNDDTIVCNEKLDEGEKERIGWYADSEKGRVYFIEADWELDGAKIHREAPRSFSYEHTSVIRPENSAALSAGQETEFMAYGGGHYLGSSTDFQQAQALCYEQMGVVTDRDGRIIWDRVNRRTAANIRSPQEAAAPLLNGLNELAGGASDQDGFYLIDASGCTLNQVLYFIDKGIPVAAYAEGGRLLLLSGYDQYNITLFDPQSGESWKLGLGDGSAYFEGLQNQFICGLRVE